MYGVKTLAESSALSTYIIHCQKKSYAKNALTLFHTIVKQTNNLFDLQSFSISFVFLIVSICICGKKKFHYCYWPHSFSFQFSCRETTEIKSFSCCQLYIRAQWYIWPTVDLEPTNGSCSNFCWAMKLTWQIIQCASSVHKSAIFGRDHCCQSPR